MLLAVAVTLLTSATAPVVEDLGAPAAVIAPATPTEEQRRWAAATAVSPQGPTANLRGLGFLDRLSLVAPTRLDDFLATHGSAIDALLASPPAAADVATWWANADVASRRVLTANSPRLVGSLEGVPYAIRDAANRALLTSTLDGLVAQRMAGVGRAAADQIGATEHMLQQIQTALDTGTSGMRRSLIEFDPNDGGRAVIAVGQLSSADYVSFLVPGMYYSVDSEIVSWANAADQVATDQESWLHRLGKTAATTAAVAWIGYQTPTVVSVASLDLARQGSVALQNAIHGLQDLRGSAQPYVSVLAHSYGATTSLLALEAADPNSPRVDALALVGSPGSPAKDAAALRVRGGNVWVGGAVGDPVTGIGVFGSQPLSAAYGAQQFGTGGAADPVTGMPLAASVGHVDYFTTGSESLRNMALIAIGRGDQVLDGAGHPMAAAGN